MVLLYAACYMVAALLCVTARPRLLISLNRAPSKLTHCSSFECWQCLPCVSWLSQGVELLQDFSDLVAQKANQQKRKAEQTKQATAAKKQKDFKF